MFQLRPYQEQIIPVVREHIAAGRRRVLITCPTGSGKTVLASFIIQRAVSNGKRAWFAVHRRELVKQSVDTLENSAGLNVGIIAAGFGRNGYHAAQVASIQTLMRRWEQYPVPDLLIADEIHHACSASWSGLLDALRARNPQLITIGLTATPCRTDGRGLEQHFDCLVQGPSTADLIEQGYLSKYRLWSAAMPDLNGVHTVAGDYNRAELEAAMSRTAVVGDALAEYQKHCAGKRAIVFMWSIQSSVDLAARFNAAGIPAAHVDGETEQFERDRIVAEFRSGRILVLSNVELFSEGFDVPNAEAGFLMRPTQSLTLYLQQVGRLLRPGKEAALIFDHAGHVARHGFPDDPREWSLEGVDAGKPKKKVAALRKCLQCFASVPIWCRSCKWCGHAFEVKPREIELEAGELQELSKEEIEARRVADSKRKRIEVGRAKTLDELKAIGRERGYSYRWAYKQWEIREKRGIRGKAEASLGPSVANRKLFELSSQFRPKK